MIGSMNLITDEAVDDLIQEALRCDKVVEAPTFVICSRIELVIPVGVLDFVRITVPPDVDETRRKKGIEVGSFFFGETSTSLVSFGIGNVNFFMADIEIATPNDELLFFPIV